MVRFSSVTMASPDPARLAAFYAEITGGEVTFVHENEWASMRCDGGRIEFMGVDGCQPPSWPEDTSLVHVDFHVDNLQREAERVELAGARRFDHQPNAAHCLVFADLDGHPFCLSLVDEVG